MLKRILLEHDLIRFLIEIFSDYWHESRYAVFIVASHSESDISDTKQLHVLSVGTSESCVDMHICYLHSLFHNNGNDLIGSDGKTVQPYLSG